MKQTPSHAMDLQQAAHGSSFYAGMRVLPKPRREAMYAIYGFCRVVDDIADDLQGDRAERAAQLAQWRADIAALYAGGDPGLARMLKPAIERFDLKKPDFDAIIDGMAMDVARDIRWPRADELDLYCDRVASAVGRLSVQVFGMEREPGLALSHHLGRALQFTNILRDIDEDAAIGRVYLSWEALEGAGIVPITPEAVAADPRIDAACRPLLAQAEAHFREAEAILAKKPKGYLIAPRLMAAVYAKLLRRMAAAGWAPPRERVKLSKPALLWTLARLGLKR
ncbi:presqualene diphosphate synthase HpnD [Stakelama sediminis]|uniref:Phytoene synthase n=1 Tax=Stakelama sediminis TaxID=463200 RepID=A0A840Z1N9_9SPHN|nr:presqualene diphosphate synthase HpnD [Stakelama sediminis]MBB5719654.1 phytoene synthase [Stakelama sediminis]